jgi:hypothetical protein
VRVGLRLPPVLSIEDGHLVVDHHIAQSVILALLRRVVLDGDILIFQGLDGSAVFSLPLVQEDSDFNTVMGAIYDQINNFGIFQDKKLNKNSFPGILDQGNRLDRISAISTNTEPADRSDTRSVAFSLEKGKITSQPDKVRIRIKRTADKEFFFMFPNANNLCLLTLMILIMTGSLILYIIFED